MRSTLIQALLFALAALPAIAQVQAPLGGGEVRVPLGVYESLVGRGKGGDPAHPARYALGKSRVQVAVSESEARVSAKVQVELLVQSFDNEWTLVPLLAAGTAVNQVTANGAPAALAATAEGLAWASERAGSYTLVLAYTVDALRSESGYTLGVPVPRTPGELTLRLPGSGLDVAVVPAAGTTIADDGGATAVHASLPAASAVQISWRLGAAAGYSLSRARYAGTLAAGAIRFEASFGVEVDSAATVSLPLFPTTTTLAEVKVDGKPAPVRVLDDERFAVAVRGRGAHEVAVSFQVPVVRGEGPPQVALGIPRVPLSRFELTLPGQKEVTVTPASPVSSHVAGGNTIAVFNLPMTESATLSWVEAIPEEARAELSANAVIYHLVHAEEGVLAVHAVAAWEITRGETDRIEIEVPEGTQVNRVTTPAGGITDWRLTPGAAGKPGILAVFLDRKVKGELGFDVHYERLIGGDRPAAERKVAVPLLVARGVHRQRGMVALLSGPELSLKPVDEPLAAKVGENQLPAAVRDQVKMTIAHTYKYVDRPPAIAVLPVPPEHKAGSFDAEVDTLVSIGEVTLKASSSVGIHVKTGSLMALDLTLPEGVNLIGLTGPSLRAHEVTAEAGRQRVHADFTQEMDGDFTLELAYERVLSGPGDVAVPTPAVEGAGVEHGRIAIEALAAVEVQPAAAEQLSSVDAGELPQQLVLKTTNPVLLAYKYARSVPAYRLVLKVTRHREVETQAAIVDEAQYRTLYTRDGLAVTAARLLVRNTRRQFLKLELPAGSEVWSVAVDGRGEKPATAGPAEKDPAAGAPPALLIPLINSAQGFAVEIVYATRAARIGWIGEVGGRLPRADLVVTHTRWDVFLPDGIRYREPRTNLDPVLAGAPVDEKVMAASLASAAPRAAGAGGTLAVQVPARGVHFAFEKLYANQGREEARFEIPYATAGGERIATALSLGGTLLLWCLAAARAVHRRAFAPRAERLLGGAALALLVIAHGWFGTPALPALVLSVVLGVVTAIYRLKVVNASLPGGTEAGNAPAAP